MAKQIDYIVYRYGSNAANQPMTGKMCLGIYGSSYRYKEQRHCDVISRACQDHTVYNNQFLGLKPYSRVTREEQIDAEEANRLVES